MIKKVIAEVINFLLILLFAYAAISKLSEYSRFVGQIGQSPILKSMADWLAWVIPFAEIFVCILLIVPQWRRKGLYGSLGLMILFTGYVIAILTFSQELPCNCGGILETLYWKDHLVLNIFFLVLSVIGLFLEKRMSKTVELVPLDMNTKIR